MALKGPSMRSTLRGINSSQSQGHWTPLIREQSLCWQPEESENNWGQQGNHGRNPQKFEYWAKRASQEVKRNVEHSLGYRTESKTADQKHFDVKCSLASNGIYGNMQDKNHHSWGVLGHLKSEWRPFFLNTGKLRTSAQWLADPALLLGILYFRSQWPARPLVRFRMCPCTGKRGCVWW